MKTTFKLALSSTALAVALMQPFTASAQDSEAQAEAPAPADQARNDAAPAGTLEDIVVTGSRLGVSGYKAPTPVTVMSAQDIANQVPKDMTDFVTQVPSIAGSMTPASRSIQASNGTTGISSPALRGLGSNRTLVLLDGQRSVPATQTGEVDIETFPQQLISRVDVVTGGASAAYGSDALSGVVNFILDKDFTGLKGEMSGGITEYGDDENYRFALSGGMKFADGRGHLLLSGEYFHTEGVFGNENGVRQKRDWLYGGAGILNNPAYTATNGQPRYLVRDNFAAANVTRGGIINSSLVGTSTTPTNNLKGIAFDENGNPYNFDYGLTDGSFLSGGDWQKSDITSAYILQPRQTRMNIFGRVSFDITDHINIYAQGAYSESRARGGLASFPSTVSIKTDNAFLPDSVREQAEALGVTSFTLGRFQTGGRVGGWVERKVQRYVVGAEGDIDALGGNWKWNVYYQRGITRSDEKLVNNFRKTEYGLALDSVIDPISGDPICRSTLTNPGNGCVPLNPFGFQAPNAAQQAYIYGDSNRIQTYTQDVVAGEMRGEPFSTWAGPVALAFGAEYRKESTHGRVDALSAANGWGVSNFIPLNGSYNVKEAFAEVNVPLIADASFTRSLDINAAVRATDYSESGYVTTWKAGLVWAPTDDIRFRVTRSRDIRAPNLSELFTQGLNQVIFVRDALYPGESFQGLQVTTGNLNLDPEKADTLGIGAVLTPRFIPGLSFSVDYYEIKVKDAIGTVAAQDIVDQCAAGVTVFCPAITREMRGGRSVITQVNNQPFNFASQKARGIDFDLTYRLPLDKLSGSWDGALTFRGVATKFIENVLDNGITPPVDLVGDMRSGRTDTPALGSIPKWRFLGTVTLDKEPFSLSFTARGVSSGNINNTYIECSSACPASTANNPTIDYNHVKGAWYFDASLTLRPPLPASPEIFFSIKNIANKDPAIVARPPSGTSYGFRPTQESIYDILGRQFRAGIRFKI
ncbi:MAG: TonB-dependent receptor [Sphingobium sp.]